MWQSVLRCWTDHWTVSEVELDLTRDPGFVLGSGSVFVSGFGGGRQRLSSAETWDEAPSDSNQLELCSNFLSSSGARFWQICMGTRVSCVPKFWSSIVCGTYVQCSMASVSSGRCWSTAAVSKAMSWREMAYLRGQRGRHCGMPTKRAPGAMRTDVLMEWSLKYSSPWQQQHRQQQQRRWGVRQHAYYLLTTHSSCLSVHFAHVLTPRCPYVPLFHCKQLASTTCTDATSILFDSQQL